MTSRIIPFGYAPRGSQERLEALMQDPTALLIDIRYVPYSKWGAYWRKEALMKRWGDHYFGGRYKHVGALGNIAFAWQGQVQLANKDSGLKVVTELLEQGYDLILLCVCADASKCHRSEVVRLIQQVMPGVEVVMPEQETQHG